MSLCHDALCNLEPQANTNSLPEIALGYDILSQKQQANNTQTQNIIIHPSVLIAKTLSVILLISCLFTYFLPVLYGK